MIQKPRDGKAMPNFKDYDQRQAVLRDIRPLDLLEEDHPARVIDRVVELLDLEELYGEYAKEGSEEYFLPDKRFEPTDGNKEGRGAYDNSRFQRQEDGSLICPEGKPMRLGYVENFDDGHTVSRYEGTACEGCPAREKCTKGERRTVAIDSR